MSKIACDSIFLRDYYPLNANRGLIAYSNLESTITSLVGRQISVSVTIISTDFDIGTYKSICNPSEFPNNTKFPLKFDVCLATSTALILMKYAESNFKLHLFKFDDSFSSISLQKTIDVGNQYGCYHLIREKIVIAILDPVNYASKTRIVFDFRWIDFDNGNSFELIENSGARLKSNFIPDRNYYVSRN